MVYRNYLITGASGFLGRTVAGQLLREGRRVRALILENDPCAGDLPEGAEIVRGDVCDYQSLDAFFSGADSQTCVIHCAGIVSIASGTDERLGRVNVGGTRNIVRRCEKSGVGRLIYVSSVHAIPEKKKGTVITEEALLDPGEVRGAYAKSKAAATSLVLEAAARGLNAGVVFPSGIIGPGDIGKGSITNMLISYLTGRLKAAVRGGYDFVDVRDVASGIQQCAEHGQPAKGYILSGSYASIRDILEAADAAAGSKRNICFLPLLLAKAAAPLYERQCLKKKEPLSFTPYSVSVLSSNGCFSYDAAAKAFGYSPRPLYDSIADTVAWLKERGMIA